MSSLSPPLKRMRLNEENENTDSQIVKSKYWFEDGNVVLQAENSLFRVHLSMLAHHSSVFKDMFNIPQPQNTTPENDASIEGCPVVVLDDKAMDVEHMISVFYDNFKTNDVREPMAFDHLAAILRLGKKYDIDHFCTEGLLRIRKEFPASEYTGGRKFGERGLGIVDCDEYLEKVINLAHELSIESILPAAYFMYVLENDSKMMFDAFYSNENNATRLSPRILMACLLGRERLHNRAQSLTIDVWADKGHTNSFRKCVTPQTCKEGSCAFSSMSAFWLHVLGLERCISGDRPNLCENCRIKFSEFFEDEAAHLWQTLPGTFSLDGWDKLKDFDA